MVYTCINFCFTITVTRWRPDHVLMPGANHQITWDALFDPHLITTRSDPTLMIDTGENYAIQATERWLKSDCIVTEFWLNFDWNVSERYRNGTTSVTFPELSINIPLQNSTVKSFILWTMLFRYFISFDVLLSAEGGWRLMPIYCFFIVQVVI